MRLRAALSHTHRHGITSFRAALVPKAHPKALRAALADWRIRLSHALHDRQAHLRCPPCGAGAASKLCNYATLRRLLVSGGVVSASPSNIATTPVSRASCKSANWQASLCSAAPVIVLASPEEGEVGASILAGVPDPPGLFYEALLALHSTTGLGWASVLLMATVIMRLSLLPLSMYSDRNSRKVSKRVTCSTIANASECPHSAGSSL